MSERLAKRVLLLAWDGADWQVIQPLLEAGRMPHLEHLIDDGVMGNLAALKPLLAPLLWSTVATGRRADHHGILGFAEPCPDGSGVRPPTRDSLRAQPLWNMLAAQGLRSAVVGWCATHPASAVAGCVVSDRFPDSRGANFADWPLPEDTVAPESLREVMADLRVHPGDITARQLLPFLADPAAVAPDDERLSRLSYYLARCATIHGAGTYLAEHESWDLLAVYYETIDRLSHEFMPYRPPRMAHIDERDFAVYRDVIDSVYQFHDLLLGRYLELVGDDTTVLLLSDMGFFSDELRPAVPSSMRHGESIRWHRDQGVFVARGPALKRDELVFGAGLLDIAPTVLTLLGLPLARDMEGRVLTQIFAQEVQPDCIDSYEPAAADPAREGIDRQVFAMLDRTRTEPARTVALQQAITLVDVYTGRRDYHTALTLLEQLRERRIESPAVQQRLAHCRLQLGDAEGCARLIEELAAAGADGPFIDYLRSRLAFQTGADETALAQLQRAVASGWNRHEIYEQIGRVHLHRRQWQEAADAFTRALDINPDYAPAHEGLGLLWYQQGEYETAVGPLLRSIGLVYDQPLAHFHLGLALAATGRPDQALDALQNALKLQPEFPAARAALQKVQRVLGKAVAAEMERLRQPEVGPGGRMRFPPPPGES